MRNLTVLVYLLFLSATLLAQPTNPGTSEQEIIKCLGVLADGQTPVQLIIAFFGLIVALKVGSSEPAKKITDRLKKIIRARHAL